MTTSLSSFVQYNSEGPHHKRVSLIAGIGLTLNMVLGVGILELPSAFSSAGIILAPVAFFFALVFVMITLLWVVEASARARGFANVYLVVRVTKMANKLFEASGGMNNNNNDEILGYDDNEDFDGGAARNVGHNTSQQERLAPLLRRAGKAKFVSFWATEGDTKPNSLAMDTGLFLNPRKLRQLTEKDEESHPLIHGDSNNNNNVVINNNDSIHHTSSNNNNNNNNNTTANTDDKDDLISRSLTFDLEYNRQLTDALEWKYKSLNHGENKSFELNELLSMFCPPVFSYIYEVGLAMLVYMGLFSFSAVFSNSMVAKFPIFSWGNSCDEALWNQSCENAFIVFLLSFGLIVVCLSQLEVVEMVWFQMLLSVARCLLVALLVFVSVGGLAADPIDNNSPANASPPYISPTVEYWNWEGAISVLSSAVFSMLITFGVPELISPLKKASDSRKMIILGISIIAIFYVFVGVMTALYFGKEVKSQININFATYRGGAKQGESIPWWALTISFFVSIFPALDVISMFPLISIVLANTIQARLIRFQYMSRFSGRAIRIFCRFLSSVPPIVIPLFQRDLSMIVKYAVVPGVYIAFVAPSLVQLYSVRMCKNGNISPKTPYSFSFLLSPHLCYFMFGVSVVFWGMIFYSLAKSF